jgi:hypothetical protein
MFPVLILGPVWKVMFGIRYIVDFQDPWLTDYYEQPGAPPPPGGRLKHTFQRWIARRFEPRVMRDVSHVIAVSPAYVNMLRSRYAHLGSDNFTVLPFGAPAKDFELLPTLHVRQRLFTKGDGMIHWVYAGRGGGDMAVALRVLFGGIAAARRCQPAAWGNVRLHFAAPTMHRQELVKRQLRQLLPNSGFLTWCRRRRIDCRISKRCRRSLRATR